MSGVIDSSAGDDSKNLVNDIHSDDKPNAPPSDITAEPRIAPGVDETPAELAALSFAQLDEKVKRGAERAKDAAVDPPMST